MSVSAQSERNQVERITVYRMGALGDTLLLVPALRELRRAYRNATLTLVGAREPAMLLQSAGEIDALGDAENPDLSLLLSGGQADDHSARRSSGRESGAVTHPLQTLSRALGMPDLVVAYTARVRAATKALTAFGTLKVVLDPLPSAGVHAARHLIEGLRELPVDGRWKGPDKVATITLRGKRLSNQNVIAGKRAVLHPGSGAAWKCASPDLFVEIAAELHRYGFHVTVMEGPADHDRVGAMTWNGEIVRLPLDEAAELLSHSALFIGHDSGLTHLAGLLGTPTVAIFGPTHPTSWRPLGPAVTVVRACTARPAPSIRVCREACSLREITTEMVLDGVRRIPWQVVVEQRDRHGKDSTSPLGRLALR